MKLQEDFITVVPKDPLVSRYIGYYYFYKVTDPHFYRAFTYYPHYMNALSIDKDAKVTWDDYSRISTYTPNHTDHILTINPRETRRSVLIGKMDRICIAFKPLGINVFIKDPLSTIQTGTITKTSYFGKSLQNVCNQIFMTRDMATKIELLDTYFVSQFQKENDSRLEKAVSIILNSDCKIEIQTLAQQIGTSRKTVLRLFKKHLCTTPTEFNTVVQFRKAFHQYKGALEKVRFSDIAYDNGYYDQSDLYRKFKNLTGTKPTQLLKHTSQVGTQPIYWTMSA